MGYITRSYLQGSRGRRDDGSVVKSSVSESRLLQASCLDGIVAHLWRHPDFQLEAQTRGSGTLGIIHTAAGDVK